MFRFITSVAFLAALAALTPSALAERPVQRSFTVTYADLDLSRQTGVETVLKRIGAASKKVCGKRPMSPRWGAVDRYLACRKQAERAAVRSIDVPAVTLAYEGSMSAAPVRTASR